MNLSLSFSRLYVIVPDEVDGSINHSHFIHLLHLSHDNLLLNWLLPIEQLVVTIG